ncbi:ABC-three component system middle component 1 [Enterococcus faecalis]|uniref:ABC-three component system middle component 1 n=1 Tax=Enterococcus faecalis TaxID=1351 RepID=UPI001E308F4B|nr:ABC-three component system middle component 1 [Enterococcus faecalis]WOA41090.1 ABC-three component system middle component 1 [Enterococcus faecalis]
MNEVIDKIFSNNGFENIPIPNPFSDEISFWGNYSKTATNFYLIVYMNEITEDFITKQVSEYFNIIKTIERGYDERIDKNLSMLICLKNNHIESLSKYKKIFEIEEDPYFFKKYLLSYNEDFEKTKKYILNGENR